MASGSTFEAGGDPTRTYENRFDALPDILEGVTGPSDYQRFLPGQGVVEEASRPTKMDGTPRGVALSFTGHPVRRNATLAAVSPQRASPECPPPRTWKD